MFTMTSVSFSCQINTNRQERESQEAERRMKDISFSPMAREKFQDPDWTADGQERASVALSHPETLWVNTGTLCNIECRNCYVHSSPSNDAFVYFSRNDLREYLHQIRDRAWPLREIGFTGGEPFMSPEMIAMMRLALGDGYRVLVLTNAMRPMMRRSVRDGLIELAQEWRNRLELRISLDHWSEALHDRERGAGTFAIALVGMRWLRDNGFRMSVAGRTLWGETDAEARAGYRRVYHENGFDIDADDPGATVLFPELDEWADVPEISNSCWTRVGSHPDQMMCASSRMLVKRKGADRPSVLACTLLPYALQFDMGSTLAEAERPVKLNHPHCAQFCVLGGAKCSR